MTITKEPINMTQFNRLRDIKNKLNMDWEQFITFLERLEFKQFEREYSSHKNTKIKTKRLE